ncbi:MAG TPA: STAS domain-containing protein [Gemmataceae bacterium]|nr:STAS domain-containing protein [Gemmataceae bacterium]
MVTSCFTRWFLRPAGKAARGDAYALPAPRHSAAAPAVQVAISQTADGMMIQIKGEPRVECAGALLDGLFASPARRPAVVTLDLSELSSISCLAVGVLVGYRRGVVRTGGVVRLAEPLQPAVREALARAGVLELFETTTGAEAAPQQ